MQSSSSGNGRYRNGNPMRVEARNTPATKRAGYDREFEPALREGLLTVREAIRRGNRRAYAEHLVLRFRLSEDLALRVTDNRVRLTDVLRATGRIPGHPQPRGGIDAPRRLQAFTLVLGLFALSALFGLHEWQRQREMGRRLEVLQMSTSPQAVPPTDSTDAVVPRDSRTSIERDELGRITKVSAGHPADVLAALCEATPLGACDMMEIQPTEPPFAGRRVGHFAVGYVIEQSEALTIRRDRETGRWVAGTGLRPIVTVAEEGPSDDAGQD